MTRVWLRLLGVERAIVEDVELESVDGLVVHLRLQRRDRQRCGICGRRSPGYDAGDGRRRWRSLDLGSVRTFIEAEAPRVRCARHDVVVAAVPWARHGAGHTRAFDDQVAWLATQCSKSAVTALLRIAWRTVGAIVERVVTDARTNHDALDGLVRIGIDEISYRRGQRYLTVVVDHDSGRLVWAADGRSIASLSRFFELLGPERCAAIELVSADGAEWIATAVAAHCPNAVLCADPFHVVSWAGRALDDLRRELWNAARRRGDRPTAETLKGSRWLLRKHPAEHRPHEGRRLADLARDNEPLYHAYLMLEQLRVVFATRGTDGIALLDEWLGWANDSPLTGFVAVARKIERHRAAIVASLTYGLSNALVEAVNTRIRLITRIAFGFHSAGALIALAMLKLGGFCPPLPGRQPAATHG